VIIGPFLFDGLARFYLTGWPVPTRFLTGHIRAGPKRAGLARLPPLVSVMGRGDEQGIRAGFGPSMN